MDVKIGNGRDKMGEEGRGEKGKHERRAWKRRERSVEDEN